MNWPTPTSVRALQDEQTTTTAPRTPVDPNPNRSQREPLLLVAASSGGGSPAGAPVAGRTTFLRLVAGACE